MAHNVTSVAGSRPAMMWHYSYPPHVFFGPLRLLPIHSMRLHGLMAPHLPHTLLLWPTQPCHPGLNRPLQCVKVGPATSHIKVCFNRLVGNFWASLSLSGVEQGVVCDSHTKICDPFTRHSMTNRSLNTRYWPGNSQCVQTQERTINISNDNFTTVERSLSKSIQYLILVKLAH